MAVESDYIAEFISKETDRPVGFATQEEGEEHRRDVFCDYRVAALRSLKEGNCKYAQVYALLAISQAMEN